MATAADTKAILDIYAPYIEHTNVTFEYVVPTEAEFAGRIEEILEKYPYLVYEEDGVIGGYAYAHQFMVRAASQWGAELSVYLAPAFQKKGGCEKGGAGICNGSGAGRAAAACAHPVLRGGYDLYPAGADH